MQKTIVILGSARSDGNTKQVVHYLLKKNPTFGFVDLNTKNIHFFDYGHSNLDDDFIPTVEEMLQYDRIIFASPVYWYSMSAIMKTFFDRITDLLKARHDLGVQLKGKTMASISCSGHDDLDESFWKPIAMSAEYLHMGYEGNVHVVVEDGMSEEMLVRLDAV